MNRPRPTPVHCCDRLIEVLAEDNLMDSVDFVPFQPHLTCSPTLLIMSDGGHGGYATINFCPFCGKKIEFVS